MLWFAPRKPRTGWSKPNKDRVEKLIEAGRMAQAGLAKIEAAKTDGSWDKLDGVDALLVPDDLAVQTLIDELGRLPGVGPKSAQRIAFHLLKLSQEDAGRLARAITDAKDRVSFCQRCFNVTEGTECGICSDPRRDTSMICVVEEPRDVVAVEKTSEFRGRYHVLQGAINPLEGIGPDQIRVRELLLRLEPEGVVEVILCTNPNIEGEATATYLVRMLRDFPGLSVTRLARGLPMGGDLEFADELTLGRALSGRRPLS